MAKCAGRRLRRGALGGKTPPQGGRGLPRTPRPARLRSLGRRLGAPGPSRCSGTPPPKPGALGLAALAAATHLIVAAGRARGRG